MSKEPRNIDRLVREKLEGFEMAPPASVWENTAASLSRGRRKRFILWFTICFTLLGIVGTGVYFFSTSNDSKKQELAHLATDQIESSSEKNPTDKNKLESNRNSQVNEKDASKSDVEKMNAPSTHINPNAEGNILQSAQMQSSRQQKGTVKGARQESPSRITTDDSTSDQLARNGDSQTIAPTTDQEDGGSHSKKADNFVTSTPTSDDSETRESIAQNYATLPLIDLRPIKSGYPSLIYNTVEEDTLPIPTPLWKSLSVEGSIGMSTFKNQPKKSTPQSMLDVLNSAASGQRSVDVRFGMNYHFTNRVSLQSGIHYQSLRENYAFSSSEDITYTSIDTVSFTVDSTTMDTTWITNVITWDSTIVTPKEVQNTYQIFTLPFQFGWSQPISTRGILEFSLGGSISIMGRNTGSVLVDDSGYAVNAQSGYHTTGMLSIGGSVKYIHRFDEHHSVYTEPWAQFGLTNQSAPGLNYESLRRRYGIRVGYRFYF